MKKQIFAIAVVVIAAFTILYSCTKETQKYSCDEKAHKYAITHQDANQSITRDSLVKLERGIQFGVFRSLTPENKKRIFNEKIDLILATLTLNDNERAHLVAMKNYSDLSMYQSDEVAIPFLVQWELKAKNVLGWSDNMIQGMVGTWATPQELIAMASGANVLKAVGGGCTCNYDISCSGIGDCLEAGCNKTKDGCGILGSVPCKGNCPEDRIKPGGGIAQ